MNELITNRRVEIDWVNHGDNSKTILHKACELVQKMAGKKLKHERDTWKSSAFC